MRSLLLVAATLAVACTRPHAPTTAPPTAPRAARDYDRKKDWEPSAVELAAAKEVLRINSVDGPEVTRGSGDGDQVGGTWHEFLLVYERRLREASDA